MRVEVDVDVRKHRESEKQNTTHSERRCVGEQTEIWDVRGDHEEH